MSGTGTAEPLLQITDGALSEILNLASVHEAPDTLALWTEITGVDEEDFTYNLSLRPVDEAGPEDLVEHHAGLTVVVPAESVERLRGATIDLMGDFSTGGLIVENPNSPSPAVEDLPPLEVTGDVSQRVRQVLSQQVNPSIALHGGRAELVAVEGDTAYLRLGGGCQGCGLASVTLRRGIEASIKRSVPEIGHVVDTTDHAGGTNPYYDPAEM
jgi:Fe/S biogenesis protein NfuA